MNTTLFVDDVVSSIRYHFEQLREESGLNCYLVRNLIQAKKFITVNHQEIRLVVIDLYLPGDYSVFNEYIDLVENIHMNQGQLLGEFLNDKYKKIPYIYISSEPGALNTKSGGKMRVFSKSPSQIDSFIQHCMSVINSKTQENNK